MGFVCRISGLLCFAEWHGQIGECHKSIFELGADIPITITRAVIHIKVEAPGCGGIVPITAAIRHATVFSTSCNPTGILSALCC